jgi:hypothetical protein
VKTGLYLAVATQISKKEKAGKPLIAADAPIGYLPGDDVKPLTTSGKMALATVCTTVEITNISPELLTSLLVMESQRIQLGLTSLRQTPAPQ